MEKLHKGEFILKSSSSVENISMHKRLGYMSNNQTYLKRCSLKYMYWIYIFRARFSINHLDIELSKIMYYLNRGNTAETKNKRF